MSDVQARARAFVTALEDWLRGQPMAQVVPRERLRSTIDELRGDDAFWEEMRPRYERAWAEGEAKLRAEQRPAREVLSPATCERILEGLERLDPDPEVAKAFLRSPAVESTLGEVLYHGITEFLAKADLIGRVVNKLPVLGPIRKKVMAVFKDEFEGRLEGQVKGFLGQFSGKAVDRLIQQVLSEENRPGFRAARRKVGEHLLERPLASLIPAPEQTDRLRDELWKGLRQAALKNEDELLEQVYADHGDETIGEWTWKLSPAATELFAAPLASFLESEAGKGWTVSGQGGDA